MASFWVSDQIQKPFANRERKNHKYMKDGLFCEIFSTAMDFMQDLTVTFHVIFSRIEKGWTRVCTIIKNATVLWTLNDSLLWLLSNIFIKVLLHLRDSLKRILSFVCLCKSHALRKPPLTRARGGACSPCGRLWRDGGRCPSDTPLAALLANSRAAEGSVARSRVLRPFISRSSRALHFKRDRSDFWPEPDEFIGPAVIGQIVYWLR